MKLRILLLAAILIFVNTACPVAFADEGNDVLSSSAQSFVSQLGITNGIDKAEGELLNRAEFAAMLVRALNYGTIPGDMTQFTDCDLNPFQKEIYMARDLGITNGTTESSFTPDGAVSANVAAKMAVFALGYSAKAEALGSYPAGHFMVANSLDLFDGIDISKQEITFGDATILIYNMLYAPKAIFESMTGNDIDFTSVDGRNLLTENFGFSEIKGIVDVAGFAGTDKSLLGKGKIGVDGKVFKTDLKNITHYLGKAVSLWYNASENKVYAIDEGDSNEIITLDASVVSDFSGDVIIVNDENGREKRYRCDELTFIENGTSVPYTKQSFMFENGTLTLIDNDSDGKIEYVISDRGEYFIIKSMSMVDRTIYDSKSKHLDVVFENDENYDISVVINGVPAEFEDLAVGMTAQIYLNEEENFGRIEAVSSKKSAVLTEIGDDSFFLDGIEFKANYYFNSLKKTLSVGVSYNFNIAPDGTITDISGVDTSGIKYAMLLGFKPQSSLDDEVMIKVLTSNDDIVVFELAKKLRLNGTPLKNTSETIKDMLLDEATNIPNYQLIKYKLNSSGEVISIDTAASEVDTWDVNNYRDEEDSLARYLWNNKVYYRSGVATPHVYMAGAVIFRVPSDFDPKPDPNKDTVPAKKLYNDEDFGVLTTGSISSGQINIDAFDFDECFVPSAVLVRQSIKGAKVSESHQEYIVERVVEQSIDTDGELVVRVKVFANGEHSEFLFKPDTWDGLSAKPGAGDIVRISTDKKGYGVNVHIAVDFKGMTDNEIVSINYTSPVSSIMYESLTYTSGKVYAVSETALALRENWKNGDTYWFKSPTGTLTMPLAGPTYVLYSERTGIAKTVTATEVLSERNSGSSGASFVVCRCVYGQIRAVFIYEY